MATIYLYEMNDGQCFLHPSERARQTFAGICDDPILISGKLVEDLLRNQ